MAVFELFPSNFLPMLQRVVTKPFGAPASSVFNIQQTAISSKKFLRAANILSLNQVVVGRRSIALRSVSQFLPIAQKGARLRASLSVIDWFPVIHSARSVKHQIVTHTLNLSQTVVGIRVRALQNTIVFTGLATYKSVRSRTAAQTFGPLSTANVFKYDDNFIATPPITLTSPSDIILTFGTLSLTLRNPDFNNAERLEIARINRRTRSGNLIIFRDPQWPVADILRFKISYLKEEDVGKLIYFLKQSLGKDITLVDYEGRTWTGIILTPTTDIAQSGRENREVQLEFQGVLS